MRSVWPHSSGEWRRLTPSRQRLPEQAVEELAVGRPAVVVLDARGDVPRRAPLVEGAAGDDGHAHRRDVAAAAGVGVAETAAGQGAVELAGEGDVVGRRDEEFDGQLDGAA